MAKKQAAALTYHPCVDTFPECTPEEREALKGSIARWGVKEAVSVWHDQIVDGRNRVEISAELGLDYPVEYLDCTEAEAIQLAEIKNLTRRHLPSGVRAAIGAKLRFIDRVAAKRGRPSGGDKVNGLDALATAAKLAGCSRSYMGLAEAIYLAEPAALDDVISRKVSLEDAHAQVRPATKPKPAKPPKPAKTGKAAEPVEEPIVPEPVAEPEPEPEVAMRDGVGRDVPEELLPVFEGMAQFAEAEKHIKAALKIYTELSDESAGVRLAAALPQVKADLRNALKTANSTRYFTECPACQASGRGCKTCNKTGWITELAFKSLPKEQQKAWGAAPF